ncbi:MAG: Uncharacterized membrane protein YhaH, DUF805 family [Chloroflexi bacterium]|nr:MAG: Uncharacterized membrane protein YhaH, DUF805 family [Chloroflexota bacterium]
MKCPACGSDNSENAQFCGICGETLIWDATSIRTRLPMMGFGEAVNRAFRQYFTFSGRATRAEHWWFALFVTIGRIVFGGIGGFAGLPGVLDAVWVIVTFIPSLAVGVRRLHDINRTGWWLLLWLVPVPVVGGIVIVVWACRQGDGGPNKYGPDPRQPASQQPYKP